MHKGDIQKDKEIARKLNNVFTSVFTLENKATEEREENLTMWKRGSAQIETSKESMSQ